MIIIESDDGVFFSRAFNAFNLTLCTNKTSFFRFSDAFHSIIQSIHIVSLMFQCELVVYVIFLYIILQIIFSLLKSCMSFLCPKKVLFSPTFENYYRQRQTDIQRTHAPTHLKNNETSVIMYGIIVILSGIGQLLMDIIRFKRNGTRHFENVKDALIIKYEHLCSIHTRFVMLIIVHEKLSARELCCTHTHTHWKHQTMYVLLFLFRNCTPTAFQFHHCAELMIFRQTKRLRANEASELDENGWDKMCATNVNCCTLHTFNSLNCTDLDDVPLHNIRLRSPIFFKKNKNVSRETPVHNETSLYLLSGWIWCRCVTISPEILWNFHLDLFFVNFDDRF